MDSITKGGAEQQYPGESIGKERILPQIMLSRASRLHCKNNFAIGPVFEMQANFVPCQSGTLPVLPLTIAQSSVEPSYCALIIRCIHRSTPPTMQLAHTFPS